jgi:hypothetical protein
MVLSLTTSELIDYRYYIVVCLQGPLVGNGWVKCFGHNRYATVKDGVGDGIYVAVRADAVQGVSRL